MLTCAPHTRLCLAPKRQVIHSPNVVYCGARVEPMTLTTWVVSGSGFFVEKTTRGASAMMLSQSRPKGVPPPATASQVGGARQAP